MILLSFVCICSLFFLFFFFQAEDGIRDLVRSRGLGDVYKRQDLGFAIWDLGFGIWDLGALKNRHEGSKSRFLQNTCLLYTSDAADDLLCVDLGGRRIIQKNTR